MWTCPKCGRSFQNTNQQHYCGEKPKNIGEYIERQADYQKIALLELQKAIHAAIPEAEERISWSMPTFWKKHNIIQFAAHKNHIGLYAGPEAVEFFAEELAPYPTSKGAIRLPYEDLPLELAAKIAAWCWETGNHP